MPYLHLRCQYTSPFSVQVLVQVDRYVSYHTSATHHGNPYNHALVHQYTSFFLFCWDEYPDEFIIMLEDCMLAVLCVLLHTSLCMPLSGDIVCV